MISDGGVSDSGMRSHELGRQSYPRTWILMDVVDRKPRILGQEVVDLSPGAIELRHAARDLREFAESRDRWLSVREESNLDESGDRHRHTLSFGPDLRYLVERDTSGEIHDGEPFRHLFIRFGPRKLTPATAAEIGLYFYGHRPAVFGFTAAGRVHGFIGMEWEPLSSDDVSTLLRREM